MIQISRTEQKRRVKEVEHLVAELVKVPPHALAQLAEMDEIRDLLLETARLEGSVRQRQIKYLTKLIAPLPLEPLYALVSHYRGKALTSKKQQHTLEFFRDSLINEALEMQQYCRENGEDWGEDWQSEVIAEIRQHLPEVEAMALSRLSYLFSRTRNPRYSRELFRYLKAAQELQQRQNR